MQRTSETPYRQAEGCRILLVDDQQRVAESIAEVLRRRGHEVRIALDGPSALEEARAFGPHLAFVDIGLPGMDGFELAERLQAEPALRRVMLVALSGYELESVQQRARDAGFDHHLVKPPSLEAMDALIGSAVRGFPAKAR
jgi:two-component system OmpR family response regulator